MLYIFKNMSLCILHIFLLQERIKRLRRHVFAKNNEFILSFAIHLHLHLRLYNEILIYTHVSLCSLQSIKKLINQSSFREIEKL